MLIKPFVKKTQSPRQITLSEPNSKVIIHPAYFGTISELKDYIEQEGRLLLLSTMYTEWANIQNKIIHDRYTPFNCNHPWQLCNCKFAKMIRLRDLYLDNENLLEVI